jgi:hypothetical protein
MAEFQINHEDLAGLKGKVVIITGMVNRGVPLIDGIVVRGDGYTWRPRLTEVFKTRRRFLGHR